jgi:hypothetical protein
MDPVTFKIIPSGDFVGTSDSQTLTNKIFDTPTTITANPINTSSNLTISAQTSTVFNFSPNANFNINNTDIITGLRTARIPNGIKSNLLGTLPSFVSTFVWGSHEDSTLTINMGGWTTSQNIGYRYWRDGNQVMLCFNLAAGVQAIAAVIASTVALPTFLIPASNQFIKIPVRNNSTGNNSVGRLAISNTGIVTVSSSISGAVFPITTSTNQNGWGAVLNIMYFLSP